MFWRDSYILKMFSQEFLWLDFFWKFFNKFPENASPCSTKTSAEFSRELFQEISENSSWICPQISNKITKKFIQHPPGVPKFLGKFPRFLRNFRRSSPGSSSEVRKIFGKILRNCFRSSSEIPAGVPREFLQEFPGNPSRKSLGIAPGDPQDYFPEFYRRSSPEIPPRVLREFIYEFLVNSSRKYLRDSPGNGFRSSPRISLGIPR